MNRVVLCSLIVLALVGCATNEQKPVFRSAPTYPKTSIQLSGDKTLTHNSGPPCLTTERPEVGVSDRERTFSEWYLSGSGGKLLVSSPSFLSDPAYAGEFQDYYRKNDVVKVFESGSGNTIVIVEDRSPAYPRRAYILLRGDSIGNWTCRELLLESFMPPQRNDLNSPDFSGLYGSYPEILEVTDSHLRYTSRNGPVRVAIESVPAKG